MSDFGWDFVHGFTWTIAIIIVGVLVGYALATGIPYLCMAYNWLLGFSPFLLLVVMTILVAAVCGLGYALINRDTFVDCDFGP